MSAYFYVAEKPCGCRVAACADEPQFKKENSKTIAEWIKKGYTVLRLEFVDGLGLNRCKCEVAQ